MARLFLTAIDLNKNELQNARVQNLASAPGSPVTGQVYYDTVANKLYWWNGSAWIDATGGAVTFGAITAQTTFGAASGNGAASTAARSDHTHGTPAHDAPAHSAIKLSDLASPTAAVSLGSQRITSLADPTSAQDAATKAYVDGLANGVDWKASVRVATTANGTLASAFANGQTVDGVTLATGDRILIKDQSTGAENGIYTVNASGAPTRATDADASAEVTGGLAVWVNEGTANADTGWVLTTNDPITVGTTALSFTQFTGLGSVTAGGGLTKTGNTLNIGAGSGITVNADDIAVAATYAGGSSIATVGTITTGVWNATDIAVADGGTGASTAAGAKTNLGFMTRYAASIGDGSSTSITVTHNLGTLDVVIEVYRNSDGVKVECDVTHATTNTLTLGFATAPTSNQYRVVVIG